MDKIELDTKLFSEILDNLPKDERERILEEAKQSAKAQQERLLLAQYENN